MPLMRITRADWDVSGGRRWWWRFGIKGTVEVQFAEGQ